MAEKAPEWTPYRYCFNNPVNLTDPTGLWEGPIFDENYKLIGHDGKNDGQAYIVYGNVEQKVREASSKNQFYEGILRDDVPGVIRVPKIEVFSAMEQSITNTLSSGLTPETQLEYGGNSWKDGTISHWAPGTRSQLSDNGNGTADRSWSLSPFNSPQDTNAYSLFSNNNSNISSVVDIWHVHPSGSTPSEADKNSYNNWSSQAPKKSFRNNAIILGAQNSKINFYKVGGTVKEYNFTDVKNISAFAKAESLILRR